MSDADSAWMREAMVEEHLGARGITDPLVLEAFLAVPRERFVRPVDRDRAYDDTALPLGGPDETISQPYIVAHMAQLARLHPGAHVLEIGTGSGYAAAILAATGARVTTVERNATLAEAARRRLAPWDVTVCVADGWFGWAEAAPFDAVLVAAAVAEVSPAWIAQLAPGGTLVVPVGAGETQRLRTWNAGRWTDHEPVAFVRLRRG